MRKIKNLNIRLICMVILIVVGCGLLIAGFIVDPLGVIHSSVLTGFGEACTFAGALAGVDCTYRFKYSKLKPT